MFEYKSPIAADRDNDSITIQLEGLEDVPCGCVTVTEDGDSNFPSFTITVDTSQITEADVGSY